MDSRQVLEVGITGLGDGLNSRGEKEVGIENELQHICLEQWRLVLWCQHRKGKDRWRYKGR